MVYFMCSMPVKKKHHKHRKDKHKKSTLSKAVRQDVANLTYAVSHEPIRANNIAVNLTNLQPVNQMKDSFAMETPVRKLTGRRSGTKMNNDVCTPPLMSYTPFKTPVHQKRSRRRRGVLETSASLSMTNLNKLFDSLESPSGDVTLKFKDNRKRSGSSIPKLPSPEKEMVLSRHQSTQIPDVDGILLSGELITETPKHTQKTKSSFCNSIEFHNHGYNLSKTNNFAEVNLNPYLKEKEIVSLTVGPQKINNWQKEKSIEELSLTHLSRRQWSSTPIDKLISDTRGVTRKDNFDIAAGGLLNNGTPDKNVLSGKLKEQIFNNSVERGLTDAVVYRREDVNLNTPPIRSKTVEKDRTLTDSMKLRYRRNGRASPKHQKLVNHSRIFSNSLSCSAPLPGQKLSREPEDVRPIPTRIGVYDRMVNRIKKCTRKSSIWSSKMIDTCTKLGLQIKNSLAWLRYADSPSILSGSSEQSYGELEDLKSTVNNLGNKVSQLQDCCTKIENEVTGCRSDLAWLKEHIMDIKKLDHCPILETPKIPPPPLAPVPPPPPPPPPPLPALQKVPPRPLLGKSKSSLGIPTEEKDARPRINLQDILNVKLKKPTERLVVRRNTISSSPRGVSKLVKLRRSTLTPNISSLSTSGGSTTKSELTTSPASSLTRLLENSSIGRVKRLTNTGRYNFNSFHRDRTNNLFSREKSGS
ncbi:uncharacterized protein [Euwallacea similis]|uniref:uncharacterized protein isoform X2 n=1 Tax=Euwallacea similis TaxID=1736056 RepID=UPI00344F9F98